MAQYGIVWVVLLETVVWKRSSARFDENSKEYDRTCHSSENGRSVGIIAFWRADTVHLDVIHGGSRASVAVMHDGDKDPGGVCQWIREHRHDTTNGAVEKA